MKLSLTNSSTMLDQLIKNTRDLITNGYYDSVVQQTKDDFGHAITNSDSKAPSLTRAVNDSHGIVAEIKFASPSGFKSPLKPSPETTRSLAKEFTSAGARGISVLTEPRFFKGQLKYLHAAAESTHIPILIKDFIIHEVQLKAAAKLGARAVLLIKKVFEDERPLLSLMNSVHELGLDVLLEVDNAKDYCWAMDSDADVIGINNRDLTTFHVNPHKSKEILDEHGKNQPVMALSAYSNHDEMLEVFEAGADAILVGTSLMKQADPVMTLRKLISRLNQG